MKFNKLTTVQKSKVSTWRKMVGDELYDDNNLCPWFRKYEDEIIAFIEEHYENMSTRRSHMNTVGVLSRLCNGENPKSQDCINKALELLKEEQDKAEDQEMSEKRKKNFVTLDESLQLQKELEAKFNQDPTLENNIKMLLVSLYCLQPPLRMNYNDMKLHDSINDVMINQKGSDSIAKSNYIKWTNTINKWVVYLNKDKVSHGHNGKLSKHGVGIITIDNSHMNYLITESFRLFPRLYLLCDLEDSNKPMSPKQFLTTLKRSYGKGVTTDILRSSYITEFYNSKKSIKQKNTLACMMRHSRGTADLVYNKLL